jgi:flagellar hook-basal body complex protein FliE
MAISSLSPIASNALQAYRTTSEIGTDRSGMSGSIAAGGGVSFGNVLQNALSGVVNQGHEAEAKSMQAMTGQGNILDVVSAVSKAELSLQTTLAVRDRVVAAYQDIMRMPI